MRYWALFLVLASSASAGVHVGYATFLGGSGDETPAGIATDSAGNLYLAGLTTSPDFPLTSTAFGTASKDHNCAFVTKLNAAGAIVWSVCLADAAATAVAVDGAGSVYVLTDSTSIVKLTPAADRIVYAKALGASALRIAADVLGNVYAAGDAGPGLATSSGAFQKALAPGMCITSTFPNAQPTPCSDAFVMKLDPAGNVVYATYLGGSGTDVARAIAVDAQGNAWITGETVSPNFPVTNGSTFQGEIDVGPLQYGDAFVAKLDATGGKLLFSTYLGGSGADTGNAIAVDGAGAAYAGGSTQTAYGAAGTGFLVKFNGSGSTVYSIPVAASTTALAVDSQGSVFLNPLSVVSPDGSAITKLSPISGWLALDGRGGVYLAASSLGYSFFPSAGALQSKFGGGIYDATVVKIDLAASASSPWVGAIVNAAGMRTGTPAYYPVFDVAPGEIVTIFGSGFDSSTRILFDGRPAQIFYVQEDQINATAPFEITGPTTQITVQGAGQTFGPGVMNVFDAVPAIFTIDGSGKGQAAVLNQDGSVNSAANPAARGSVVAIFMTGVGRMNPAPVLGVGCNLGAVTFAGQAPELAAGAVQVNVQLADGPVGDKVPLVVYIGNYASGFYGDTTIAVK
jgi:uncharacterized protein (TIGR03437 family)